MAGRSIYNRKWHVRKCGVANCWCRMIVTSAGLNNDDLENCVICAGEVSEKLATYLVNLHNTNLKCVRKT